MNCSHIYTKILRIHRHNFFVYIFEILILSKSQNITNYLVYNY